MSAKTWTIESILRVTREFFASKGIDSARLDAELLLMAVVGVERVQLYTQFDRPLSVEEEDRYRELVRRRGRLEPVAYILGYQEFYGRRFKVSPAVLIPRPETEHLIDAVLEWARRTPVRRVLDVGTGSGCISVTLAAEIPGVSVVATDVSRDALAVARMNAQDMGVGPMIEWLETDLYPDRAESFDVIVSNPPYVAEGDPELEVPVERFEPALALFGGQDGLDMLRRLLHGMPERLATPGLFAAELGAGQAGSVERLLGNDLDSGDSTTRFVEDLQGHRRVVLWERGAGRLQPRLARVNTGR